MCWSVKDITNLKDTLIDDFPASLWRLSHSLIIGIVSVWYFLNWFFQTFLASLLSPSSLAENVKAFEPFAGALCIAQACPQQPQEKVGKQTPVRLQRTASNLRLHICAFEFVSSLTCSVRRCWFCKHCRGNQAVFRICAVWASLPAGSLAARTSWLPGSLPGSLEHLPSA